jgi:protein-S-isoprenylcysteine O-methyltransferase
MTERLLPIVVVLFAVSEIALAVVKRSGARATSHEDRGSMRALWISILFGMALGFAAQWVRAAHIHAPVIVIDRIALCLLLAGLALRWTAILTLGRLFTVDVAIQSGHVVVEKGLYRWMRHPSYTGLIVAFAGLGLYFQNWFSLVAILVPMILALLSRVRKEEQALLASLGPDYAAYCARTKRFIPGVV